MTDRLVKLVRDNTARNLSDSKVIYKPVEDKELALKELRKKLIEESVEYLENPSLEELTDVYEVLIELVHSDLGLQLGNLIIEADSKRVKRGSFEDFVGMYVNTKEADVV